MTWSTGGGLFESVAALPWPVMPFLGISPPPEALMPSMPVRCRVSCAVLEDKGLRFCLPLAHMSGMEAVGRGQGVVPSPFSTSGMGATFLVWSMVAYSLCQYLLRKYSLETALTSPELPWTMFWPSMGPLSEDPSPLRGMVVVMVRAWVECRCTDVCIREESCKRVC